MYTVVNMELATFFKFICLAYIRGIIICVHIAAVFISWSSAEVEGPTGACSFSSPATKTCLQNKGVVTQLTQCVIQITACFHPLEHNVLVTGPTG